MKEIKFNYLKNWKVSEKFQELYHKQISIIGKLDSNRLTIDDIEDIDRWNKEEESIRKYDLPYTCLVDINNPKDFLHIYIGGSIINLLEELGLDENYNGKIRVYGEFGSINTTRTNIGKIWKIDLLDEKGDILKTVKNLSPVSGN